MAIHITKDLVSINLVKGTLGPVANILITAQACRHDPRKVYEGILRSAQPVIKNHSDFLAIVKI
jgi:hypothetical protein